MNPDYAWAAGFYEGEGSIVFTGNSGLVLSIAQVTEEPLLKMQKLFGGKIKPKKIYNSKHQPAKVWMVTNLADCKRVISLMSPWLSERRMIQAWDKIEFMSGKRECRKARSSGEIE